MSKDWTSCFLEGPYWKRGQVLLLRLHFFQKKATPSNSISVACLQRRLFSQIHGSWEEAMASTACPFCEGGHKDVFSILASVFAFSRASFGNSVWSNCVMNMSTVTVKLATQSFFTKTFSCSSWTKVIGCYQGPKQFMSTSGFRLELFIHFMGNWMCIAPC